MNYKNLFLAGALLLTCPTIQAIDNPGIAYDTLSTDNFTLVRDGIPAAIFFDNNDDKGISRAVENLARDFHAVTGRRPAMLAAPKGKNVIIVGSLKN
ncbi:MAG: glycosyhydrolase, partial [Muribaculaceae bacterium]|nr:glycosyhydrolase [Muribaculaceae bacterium]